MAVVDKTKEELIIELDQVKQELESLKKKYLLVSDHPQRGNGEFSLQKVEEKLLKSEEKYRNIFESITDIYYEATIDGTLLEISPSIEIISKGQYTREEVIGTSLIGYYANSGARDAFFSEIIKKGSLIDYELSFLNKDGSVFLLSISSKFIYDTNGIPVKIAGTMRDITERKKAETEIREFNSNLEYKIVERTEELAEMNNRLLKEIEKRRLFEIEILEAKQSAEKANREKSEFLSRMSHELRTPLNAILGFAQLMNMSELTPGHKKGVSHILQSGKHLLELINEVLDISGIEEGRMIFSYESMNMVILISEILDLIQPLTKEKHIKVQTELSGSQPLYVWSDKRRLSQILINLLSNAIKYNRENGSVDIKTEKTIENEDGIEYARISIIDTGIGISSMDIPKLFNPFVRLATGITQTEGTGLGLTVVKKLITDMNGRIGVESVLGEGTIFWIEIPLFINQ